MGTSLHPSFLNLYSGALLACFLPTISGNSRSGEPLLVCSIWSSVQFRIGCMAVIGCRFTVGLVCGWHFAVMGGVPAVHQCPFVVLLSLPHVNDAWWTHWLLSWAVASFSASQPLPCCLASVTQPVGPGGTISLVWAFSKSSALPGLCCLWCALGAVYLMVYHCTWCNVDNCVWLCMLFILL